MSVVVEVDMLSVDMTEGKETFFFVLLKFFILIGLSCGRVISIFWFSTVSRVSDPYNFDVDVDPRIHILV